jgi:hypothetical protein
MPTTAITLGEALLRIERQIADLQKKADILRQAGNIVASTSDSASTFDIATAIVAAPTKTERPQSSEKMTQHAMAKKVLLAHGKEMHVGHITAEIKREFGVIIKPSYLAPVMHRQIGVLFYRSDSRPNTFGLIEWKKPATEESRVDENVAPHQ